MQIRAKLRCISVLDQTDGAAENPQKTGEHVGFTAQYSDNAEDNSFAASTPSADMSMMISNPECFGAFVENSNYYFDITPAE